MTIQYIYGDFEQVAGAKEALDKLSEFSPPGAELELGKVNHMSDFSRVKLCAKSGTMRLYIGHITGTEAELQEVRGLL